MPVQKRDREEEEETPARGGPGVESPSAGYMITIETLMEELAQTKAKIDEYVKKLGEQGKELEEKNAKIQEQQIREEQLKRESETQRESEKKALEYSKNELEILKNVVKAQGKNFQELKAAANTGSSPQVQELEKQLNGALAERTVAAQQLATAQQTIAQLQSAASTQCAPNPDQFIEKWKFQRQRELAQQEIAKREATIKDLTQTKDLLKREQLRQKVQIDEFESVKDNLEDQLEELSKTITELEEENEGLQEELEGVREEINESWQLELSKQEEENFREIQELQETIARYRHTTVDRNSYISKVADLNDATQEIARLQQLVKEGNSPEKDAEINRLEAQVAGLHGTIAETERRANEKIGEYEAQLQGQQVRIQERETIISKNSVLATTKINQLEEHIAHLREEITVRDNKAAEVTTQLAHQTAENTNLHQQIQDLGEAAQRGVHGEQGNAQQFRLLYEQYHAHAGQLEKQAKELQAKVDERDSILRDYEAQARAHVCTPAVPTSPPPPPPPPPAPTTITPILALSISPIRCESTAPVDPTADPEFEAAYAALIAATEKWSYGDETDSGYQPPRAPATAAEAIRYFAPRPSRQPTTPPSSPPSPAYDPREDVPDIESWWYDEDRFAATWEFPAFEYRRTIPYCDNCRTRRALRPDADKVGEWKLPADHHRHQPCAAHRRWKADCADCIESDSPSCSSLEHQLPEQLKKKLACRGWNCPPHHDQVQQRARWVLWEHQEKVWAEREARERHAAELRKYRAVYGWRWPAQKAVL